MPFTAGVGSADELFAASSMEFEIVGYLFTARMGTKDQSIRWVFKDDAVARLTTQSGL
jgi:hypothetical protein